MITNSCLIFTIFNANVSIVNSPHHIVTTYFVGQENMEREAKKLKIEAYKIYSEGMKSVSILGLNSMVVIMVFVTYNYMLI